MSPEISKRSFDEAIECGWLPTRGGYRKRQPRGVKYSPKLGQAFKGVKSQSVAGEER